MKNSTIFYMVFHVVISLLIIVTKEISAQNNEAYYTTTDLGSPNSSASSGNPFKGFLTNPDWNSVSALISFPSSLDFYYIGLNDVMSNFNTFDWDTTLEVKLDATASRNRHAILRFVLDTPATTTQVPQFLIDGGLSFNDYTTYGGGKSPNYNDTNLKTALQQFITAFGQKYDGDIRIAFVQVGLLGFWGEWHTYTDGTGLTESWIPDSLKDDVVMSFADAMSVTPVQVRYPWPKALEEGFGLHDDSFAYATLDGTYNGNEVVDWFFWPTVKAADYTEFWKNIVMGGEIYPPLQEKIFSDSYPAYSSFHQDFAVCTKITHATYMLDNYAFSPGYPVGELDKAITASQDMGYSFRVKQVEVAEMNTSSDVVSITAEIVQVGVAPFYYPLDLTLSCSGMTALSLSGVDSIIEEGSSKRFTFDNVPATKTCLDEVEIKLSSSHVYSDNPVKFSQGVDGSKVVVNLPLPTTTTTCIDSTLRFKLEKDGTFITRDCTWVGNKPNRCTAYDDGIVTHCPKTCNQCSICQDGSNRFKVQLNGKKRNRDCTWVANRATNSRCKKVGVRDTCRKTCGRC